MTGCEVKSTLSMQRHQRLSLSFCEFVYGATASCEDSDEDPMDSRALLFHLQKTGRALSSDATAVPLAGGVSSEIWLVTDGLERFVVKRALPKLKVRDDWFADPARNCV